MNYDQQFLIDSIALLQHKRVSHMGEHQYVNHGAMRGDFPMSGTLGWQRYENDCPSYYIPGCEKELIKQAAAELGNFLEPGTPLVDFGPGTLAAVEAKSLLLASALQSRIYAPVDASLTFCHEAGGLVQRDLPGITICPCIENFFSDDAKPAIDIPALGFLGGTTIANIEAPLCCRKPTAALISTLKTLGRIAGKGWLLVSTDSNQDEAENKATYSENGLFEINTFDRMAYELPISGLDPTGIIYEPVWVKESGQLAHSALAVKDMSVSVEAREFSGVIQIRRGERFHLKNSFRFTDEYFLSCVEQAGLCNLRIWRHSQRPLQLFLLKA